jgi:parvulin-like peptidyl-prolyl isomerase
VLLTICAVASMATAQVLDRIVAVVDGAPITQSDVAAAMQLALVAPAPGADAVGGTVDALVERRLILEEVDRYAPPEPPAAEIDRRVAEIRARLGSRFTPVLAEVGLTEDQLRREVRDTLRIEAYLQQRFGAEPSDGRAAMIREWLAGLRRRANINILPR